LKHVCPIQKRWCVRQAASGVIPPENELCFLTAGEVKQMADQRTYQTLEKGVELKILCTGKRYTFKEAVFVTIPNWDVSTADGNELSLDQFNAVN
jgi:hypothetical protein